MSAAAKSTARKELECLLAKLAVDDKPGAVKFDQFENGNGRVAVAEVVVSREPLRMGRVYVEWGAHSAVVGEAVLAAVAVLSRKRTT